MPMRRSTPINAAISSLFVGHQRRGFGFSLGGLNAAALSTFSAIVISNQSGKKRLNSPSG